VIANLKGDNVILCQITTKKRPDPDKTRLTIDNFETGGLKINSFIMPSILSTIRKSIILYKSGRLREDKIKEVENKVIEIIKR